MRASRTMQARHDSRGGRFMRWTFVVACLLAGSAQAADAPSLESFGAPGGEPAAPWHVVGLPQQTKPFTRFSVVELDGKRALKVESEQSYGNLVHPVQWSTTSAHLAWQWRIDEPIPTADLR